MCDHGRVTREAYSFLCSAIKNGMDTWQNDCSIYNDPYTPNLFFFL